MPSDVTGVYAVVRGMVQGVGFRYWVQREARMAGLGGWVRNREDGSVECRLLGPRAAVEAVLERLGKGPAGSDVSAVEVEWGPPDDLGGPDFEILL
ncbi:MAG: acylphosphatase [Candidatus Dormibacterales bacterium]